MTITVYSKPGCVQCVATIRAMAARALLFDVVDLTGDPDALEMVTGLGYREAPVVVADDQHWSGFQPERIKGL